MPAPTDFLAALGAAFTGYGKDQQQHELTAERQAKAAEQAKRDAATALNMQEQRYLQGFRNGTAPDADAQHPPVPFGTMGTADIAPPSRYQTVGPDSYLDTTATPEAIQQRRASAADVLKQANEARLHREKVQSMVGVQLPNGTTITPAIAEAMIANPSLGGAFVKVAAPEKPDRTQLVPNGTDAHGNPVFGEYNKETHRITAIDSDVTPHAPGVAGGGGVAQNRSALLMSSVTEARLADERMRKYEDKLLNGGTNINPLSQAGGTLAMNLSGTHSVMGSLLQAGSEGALNMKDPEFMQYMRDAAAIGRAESMVMPRGGNEAMVRSNSVLARAGAGATESTINAARMARQALFGVAGGLTQAMTPAQTQKLEAGVQRIKSGEHGAAGGKPSLHDRVQQLKAQGVPKAQAMQTLQQEGYDLHGGD